MTEIARHFRKLDEHPRISLLRLPAWVRGYLDEILRFAERPTGKICDTVDPADVAFAIRAQPDEFEQLTRAIRMLITEGALTIEGGALHYADFGVEQRNYEAARKATQRAKAAEEKRNVPDNPVTSHKIREDQRRGESPQPPEGGRSLRRREPRKTVDAEERRRVRKELHADAACGVYGKAMRERAAAAQASPDSELMRQLLDELERGEHPRKRLVELLPPEVADVG